ncbi:MAG: restriction endonuclease subunit S [Candidatus Thiodiazotropha sp. (ex Lucinoma kastoroae)]|nr:restriction endonuclease subunit S [Candidatus Thiodiazotropha sp. (ex Lucinoma kastoroae)]
MIRPSSLSEKYPKVRLGDAVEFLDHMRKPVTAKDRVAGPYPYYGANGQQDSVKDYIFDEPLVLLAEDGGNFGDPNRTIAYQVEGKCWVNNHAHVLRPTAKIDIRYLCRHLEMYDVRSHINGATREKLNKGAAQEIVISLPPLEEQKLIAAILDKADALRRKRQQAIDLTDQLLRSVFLDMFGDPALSMTITELLDKEYLFLHKDGNHGGNYPRKEEFGNKGIPFISAKDISDDDGRIIQSGVKYLNETKARKLTIGWLEKGDVLLAHNATVGRVGIFHGEFEEALIGTSLTAFRPNPKKLMSQYLFCALKYSGFQEQLKKNMGQSTRNQVPITAQKEMIIPIGDLMLQKKFKGYFDHMLGARAKHLSYIDQANKCFASLTQQAFLGKLTKRTEAA